MELVGKTVVAKHAVGPDKQPDGSEQYPSVPVEWVPITFEQYTRVGPGWIQQPNGQLKPPPKHGRPLKLEERIAKLEARVQQLEGVL